MQETLKMMKSILNGKENQKNEKELIKEYQESLSPNILAYFYISNYGMISRLSNLYPTLDNEDKASFCLQILDISLQKFDSEKDTKFTTYFYKCFNNKLYLEYTKSKYKKRNAKLENIDNLQIAVYDDTNNIDNILNEYSLTDIEKKQCKLFNFGYTAKEIAKLFKISQSAVSQRNSKIKSKILNSI